MPWCLSLAFLNILLFTPVVGARCNGDDNLLDGKHLRVATASLYTVVDINFDADGYPIIYGGIGYDYLQWLSRRLRFTYEFTSVTREVVFGSNLNGTWDGLIGLVDQKEVDLALSAFTLTHEWYQAVDLTVPWIELDYTLFIPLPTEQEETWSTLKPFQAQVWISFTASMVVIAALFWLNAKLKKPSITYKFLGVPLMYVTSVITAQGGHWNKKGRSAALLGATWCFAALMFVNIYNGMLVSSLTTTRYTFLVNSLEDLTSKPETEFFTFKDANPEIIFRNAASGAYKPLGDSLRRRPGSLITTVEDCMAKPMNGSSACIMPTKPGESYLAGLYASLQQCPFTRTKDTFMLEYNVFALPKNSPYTDTLSIQILWTKAFGLDQKWSLTRMKQPHRCLSVANQQVSTQRIDLNHIKSAFFILTIGHVLSSTVFVAEIVYNVFNPN